MTSIAKIILSVIGILFVLLLTASLWLIGIIILDYILKRRQKMLRRYNIYLLKKTKSLDDLAKRLEERSDAKKRVFEIVMLKYKSNAVAVSLVTACIAAVLFIVTALVLSKCFDFYICNENIVLVFVGILATFVVVTNYAQVVQIRKDCQCEIEKMRGDMATSLDDVKTERGEIVSWFKENVERIKGIQKAFICNDNDFKIAVELAIKLNTRHGIDAKITILKDEKSDEDITATIIWKDGKLLFYQGEALVSVDRVMKYEDQPIADIDKFVVIVAQCMELLNENNL